MKKLLDDLGPWHFDFEITDGIETNLSTNRSKISFRKPKGQWLRIMSEVDIDASNSNMLDCGCNSGAMCFFAAKDGFNLCVGVDAHKHWIDQAEFVWDCQSQDIQKKITFIKEDIQNYKSDIEFDLVLFNGIFYHLAHPIYTLEKITKIIKPNGWIAINTAAGKDNKGNLKVQTEGTAPMSGIHGLSIRPDGPDVLITILRWLGFHKFKIFDKSNSELSESRVEIIAKKLR